MNKRIFAMLLAVCMIMAMLPMNVLAGAAEDHTKYEALTAHDDAKHICEHCIAAGKSAAEATVTWTAWGEGKTTLPTAAGHYYLTADLKVTAATISSGHVVLDLNGKTVTANGTSGNTADRFYNVQKDACLTIVDCTASGEGDTYKAGKFTGASNIAFNTSNSSSTKSTGVITVYDGIFEKNVSAVTGNVFLITGSAKLYVYGGRFAENDATNKKGAGVIYGNAGANYIHLENAVFYKNTAGYGGAVYHAGSKTSAVPVTMKVINCTFDSNSTNSSTGAALCYGNNAVVEIEGSTFTNNTALTAGGAIRLTGTTGALTVKDSTFTGNTGTAGAGAIWAGSNVTLENVTIKENVSKGTDIITGKGAITLGDKDASTKAAQTLTIKGNTQIIDNTDGAGAQCNVYMTNGTDKIVVSNLAAAAKISVAGALNDVLTDAFADAESVKGNFLADNAELAVDVADDKLVLAEKSGEPVTPPVQEGHTHCICGDISCTKTTGVHKQVTFEAWGDDDSEKGKLPASGNYYLHESMTLTTGVEVSGELNLCLNGKYADLNNKSNTRLFALTAGDVLSITDCEGTGELKGGNRTYGGAVNVGRGSVVNLFGGRILNNTAPSSEGGAFYVAGGNDSTKAGAIVNMYGGEIYGNTAKVGAAVRLTNPSGAGTRAQFNMYGGKIWGNEATQHGAVYADKGDIQLLGGEISNNTSAARGAVAISSNASLTLGGDIKIESNTSNGNPANLYLVTNDGADAKFAVDGLSSNAKIGVGADASRLNTVISTNTVDAALLKCFTPDAEGMSVDLKDGKLILTAEVIIPDHPHKLCNDAACADHAEMDFKNWDSATSLPTSGNYSLQTDVVLTAGVTISGTLNLCLNGHSITVNKTNTRAFALGNGAVLSITDCQGTGKITGGSRTYGAVVNAARGSTFNLFGGIITGNTATTASGSEGGAVYVGGGNDTTTKGAIFNMYGGEISNNTAQLGSAVRLTNPSGAGTKAQFNMYGGKITGNENTGTTTSNYGVINADKATVKLMGGQITGNTSAHYGAVYVTANTDLTLGGEMKITGNTVGEAPANLYLSSNTTVFTVDGLTGEAMIAVSVTASDVNRAISTATATDYSKYFTTDSTYRAVTYKDQKLYLTSDDSHKHCLCKAKNTDGCDHADLVWIAWESTTSLPNADGNYYLLGDVQLKDVQWIKNRNTNICLNGHTVTAAAGKRVLSTQETTVLGITDCAGTGKLTGGNSTFGGCIGIQAGSTVNLFAGTITGNESLDESSGQGGAIYLQAGGTLNMFGGAIAENQATLGGAIYGKGKAYVNIYGGQIRDNQATTYGGAIYTRDGNSQINLGAATIQDNYAKTGGGAVYTTGANAVLNITGTTFKDNTIGGYGGGAVFAQSSGTKITVDGATFTGSLAQAGGAIYAGANTTMVVDNTYFAGNTAKQGACIYEQRADVTLYKVTMENNAATDKAAGIYVKAGSVVMDGVIIKNNTNTGSGTAITTGSDSVTVDGEATTVYPTVTFKSGTISGHKGTSGGAILLQSKTVFTMSGGSITGNTASYGGAIYVSTNATFIMTGGTMTNNTAKTNGGAIYALRSTVKMTGGTISGNFAEKMGGGVFLSGANMTMSGASIVSNKTATGTGGGAIGTGSATADGVKIGSTITINGGNLSNNYGRHGGAILLQGTDKTVLTVNGGTFHNNEGKVDGGAFYVSTNTTLKMTGGSFKGNYCAGRAGAIFFNNSKCDVDGTIFQDNAAGSSGGAITVNGRKANVSFKNVTFQSHEGASGGTFCHQGFAFLYMENVTMSQTHARNNGGGLYLANNVNVTLVNVSVSEASTEKVGGGMYWGNNAVLDVKGLVIENCNAVGDGGAIYSRSGCAYLDDVKLIGNQSGRWGGGLIIYRPAMQGVSGQGDYSTGHVVTNIQVRNNTSADQGGGIHSGTGCRLILDGAVITGNTAGLEGGGIWSQGDLTLRNVDVNGNGSGGEGYAVYLMDAMYDGHSYAASVNKMSGNVKIENNQNGEMYMGPTTTISVEEAGMGQDTIIYVTLDSGVLTNRVFGKYNYEGGDREYTITYGDRSFTDPEYDPTLVKTQEETGSEGQIGDVLLYAGVGLIAVAAIAAVLLILKKKKSAAAENK